MTHHTPYTPEYQERSAQLQVREAHKPVEISQQRALHTRPFILSSTPPLFALPTLCILLPHHPHRPNKVPTAQPPATPHRVHSFVSQLSVGYCRRTSSETRVRLCLEFQHPPRLPCHCVVAPQAACTQKVPAPRAAVPERLQDPCCLVSAQTQYVVLHLKVWEAWLSVPGCPVHNFQPCDRPALQFVSRLSPCASHPCWC